VTSRRLQHWYETTHPDLVAAIQAAGRLATTPEQSQLIDDWVWETITGEKRPRGMRRGAPLSRQQIRVLHYLSLGFTEAEVAEWMNIRPTTVQCHKARIRAKLGARNMTQAVAIWIRSQAA
jgi:DNA-binding NarL/FixJ family response regulator